MNTLPTSSRSSGLSSYGVDSKPEAIQKELMTYGPVEVAFEVYADFFHYKSGVYVVSTIQLMARR